jgi:hypothetical protein
MGVIRKKTAARGGEGGIKYMCDVCSADITSTVSPLLSSTQNGIPHLDCEVLLTRLLSCRFESDAHTRRAMSMTSVCSVLRTATRRIITSRRRIRTA